MLNRYLIIVGWGVVVISAGWLRFQNLDERPIHADEATGARLLAERLEGDYRFDPKHFHGPTQSAISSVIARIRGETSWEALTVTTLRLGPALAGTLLVLTPLLWVRRMGGAAALATAALLATSPHLVYYSRMFIHESWLALFGMLALAGFYRFLTNPRALTAILAGGSLGLMYATKETVAISGLSWLAATAAIVGWQRFAPDDEKTLPGIREYLKPAALLAGAGLVTSLLVFTNGLRDLRGFLDAVATFFIYETGPGQDKPFFYYAHLLVIPKLALGLWWSEGFIVLLALGACGLACWQRFRLRIPIFLATSALAHLSIYSLIGYKTPWLMMLPWANVCLLAGFIFIEVEKRRTAGRVALALAFAAGLAFQTTQSLYAIGRYANDARNPYAYVPTTRDPEQIARWLGQLEEMAGPESLDPIAVTGREYWPLPWFLRGFETIGYWPRAEEGFKDFPVILAMPGQVASCDAFLADTHVRLPRSLRDNVHVVLYLRNDLWNRWTEASSP